MSASKINRTRILSRAEVLILPVSRAFADADRECASRPLITFFPLVWRQMHHKSLNPIRRAGSNRESSDPWYRSCGIKLHALNKARGIKSPGATGAENNCSVSVRTPINVDMANTKRKENMKEKMGCANS